MDDLSSLVPSASDDGLDSLVIGSKTNNVNTLRGSQFVADPVQPDQMGEAIHLANEFQTDPWFVHDNLQNFKAQKPSFNIPRLVDDAPGVTKFFFKPENAALGKDDLDPLSRIDRGTQIVSKSYLKDLGEAASSGFNDARKSMISFAVSHGQITPEQAAKQMSEIQAEESKLQPPKYLDEMNKSFHEAGKNIEVAANKYSEAIKNYQDGQILESLKNFGSGTGTSIGALLDYAKTAVTHLKGVGYVTAQGLSSYAPVLATGELGGVTGALAGGPFAPVTGALGGMGGLFLSGKLLFSGQRFNQKLLERGIDPNDKDALLKAYSDPQLMADIRKDSDSYGTTFSVLNSLFGGLGGVFQKSGVSLAEGLAARATRSGAGVALQTGGQAISSMAAETAATGRPNTEEALQMAFSNLAPAIAHEVVGGIRKSKSVVENPDVIPPEPTQSDVIDIPPEDVVIRRKELLSKYPENPVKAVKDVAMDTHEAVQTLHDIQAMAEMGDAVKESKVAKRVPDKIDELVQSSGGKGFVYFQSSDWDQYFLNKGLSPAKAAAQVMQDDGVAYMRSKEAGTPIVIPLSTYISRLAPTEHYDALLNFVRTSPEGMNFVEAKTHMEQLPETMTALSEKAKAPIPENEQIIQIKEDTKRQLIEAGVPEEQAARISEVNAAFYTTQAKNHGLDPLSLYKEQGIVFNGPGIEGQRLSQSDAPMPSKAFEKFGKSKEGLAGYIANPKSNLEGQTLFQKGDEGHRGQITIGPNQTFNIELFKSADASTPIHELGHAYLEILNNLYIQGGGSDQSKADFETIREWLGAKEGERFTTEQHEQFSRGFEAYMMEGKAPSNALRRAFQSFMKWLTNIYRSVLNLKVELSDNVRAVFDRMLASEEEIQSKIPEPLFREPTLEGMTPKQAESYTKLQSDLQEHSASILRESLMKDLERLKNPIYKEIEAKVEAQVNEDPGFNALSILQKGKLADGSELSEGMWPIKLSKESVKSDYGVDRIDRLPKGIYGADGLHPDIAANFLGFKSGEDLLGTLENLPDKKSLIKTITDETAKETYPNAFDEPQFSNEVLKAIYNEKLKDMLRMELEHLASENLPGLKGVIRNINRRSPTDLEVRAQAKGILADRALNNLRPIEFSRAADKARKEAGVLLTKGDIDGAFEAKRRELLNIELFRQAQTAQTNIRKGLQRFKKAARSDADLSVSRDLDFVNAARALLASFGLGRPTEKPASEYLQSTESYNPDRFQDLQNLIDPLMKGSKNYTDLTYSEFLDLKQGFDALWHLAKEEKSILIDGKKMAIEEAKLKIKNQSDKLTNVKAPKRARKSIDDDARFKADFSKLSEYATLMESLMQRWDLENIDGPFQSLFFRPVNEAIENYRSAKEKTLSKLDQIYNDLFKNISSKDIYAPELDFTFRGKGHLLGALLHRGNLSNFSKFLRGYGFGFLDENGNLDQSKWDRFMDRMHKDGIITKSDYDHIQKIWDLFEELKPEAQKAHYQIRGYYFDEITHQPFKTPFGEYPGGYFPATADPFADTDLMSRKEKEDLKKQAASFAFPTTGSGFTKKRVEAYAAPLQLDPNYIKPALDWVLRFSHIEPKIADVRKLLSNREVRSLIKEINPNAIGEVVVPWLQRSGTQRLIDPSGNVVFDKAVKHIRQAAVLNFLGFDIINALQQQGGNLTALLKVPAKYLRDAHIEFLTSPLKTTQWISEQSEFMKNHSGDQLYKLEESTSDIVNNPTYFEKSGEIVQKASTFLTRISQHYVDQVTWLGAYNHSVATADKTKTLEQIHKQAVRAADSAVRLTQGSGFPEHVSKWATGSRAKSLLTIFSNYWVVMSNLYKQKSFIARAEQGPGAKEWARANARKLYAFGLTAILPTLFAAFMSSILRGKKKDRDDDGSVWDDYAMSFGTQMASASANIAAPGVGSQVYTLAQAIDHIVRDKGGPYAANIQISPVISSAEKSIQGGVSAARAIKQHKKLSGSQIQDVFTLLGLVTKIPAAPLARPFSYLRDVNEGNIKPAKNPVDLVRGLLTGTGEKRKLR